MRWLNPQGGLIRARGKRRIASGRGNAAPFSVSIGSGNVTSGTLLTATVNGLVGGETVTYQWTQGGTNISGATSSTFTPTIGTAGVIDGGVIRCVATVDGEPYPSNARTVVRAVAVNTVAPVVSGSLTLGATLSTTNGTWTGATGGSFSYQWQRGGVNIAGATSNTYTIVVADSGAQVRCVVTYTNSGGAASANSNAVTVQTFAAPSITGVPTISGTTTVGQTLTASAASVAGNPTPARTWQWERSGTPIGGATSGTYTLVEADEGATVTVVQTETNALGTASAESAATATIAAAPPSVNPALTLTTQTPGSGGNPDSVAATYSYAGSDDVDLYVVTTNTATPQTQANIIAGSGGGIIEGDSDLGYTGGTISLDGFSTNTGVTHIQAVAVERNNSGTSGVQVIEVVAVDFTAPVFLSAEATGANTVVVTVDEELIGANAAGNWSFNINGSPATITGVSGTGATRTLTVSDTMAAGQTLNALAYTPGNLTNVRGNALAAFSGQAITNNVPAASFHPSDLFTASEDGFAIIPSPATSFESGDNSDPAEVGDLIPYQEDSSGEGRHFNQTVLAGRPTLEIDGSTHFLQFSSGRLLNPVSPTPNLLSSSGVSFFARIRIDSLAALGPIITGDDGGGSGRQFQFRVTTAGRLELIGFNAAVATVIATGATTLVTGTWYNVAGVFNAANSRVWVNTMTDAGADATATNVAGTLNTANLATYRLAGGPAATSFAGRLAFGLCINRSLTEAERIDLATFAGAL